MPRSLSNPKSSALFHFTAKNAFLRQILTNGFEPRYSMEYWPWFNNGYFVSHAMTCFCDIPLSRISNHVDAYGRFGIGMKREWAKRNRLQPITYCPSGSASDTALRRVFSLLKSQGDPVAKEAVWNLSRMYKVDFGPMFDRKGHLKNKDFTQESEWRYVPHTESYFMGKNKHRTPDQLSDDEILTLLSERDKHGSKYNNPEVNSRLTFCVSDIAYIFVSTESQLISMISFIENLENLCGQELSKLNRSILLTKLTSLQTIRQDY